jgi:hypothetical protein
VSITDVATLEHVLMQSSGPVTVELAKGGKVTLQAP